MFASQLTHLCHRQSSIESSCESTGDPRHILSLSLSFYANPVYLLELVAVFPACRQSSPVRAAAATLRLSAGTACSTSVICQNPLESILERSERTLGATFGTSWGGHVEQPNPQPQTHDPQTTPNPIQTKLKGTHLCHHEDWNLFPTATCPVPGTRGLCCTRKPPTWGGQWGPKALQAVATLTSARMLCVACCPKAVQQAASP